MHATRGGWLGQTFALAKFDDSFEGKKSGIRRSKKERKGMVETFIRRYQKLNNGDFPSLNLTRKEVGGSFYTVREIVREIIQENRVLGPPKSPPGDQNIENLDSYLEHSPLSSISVDHPVHAATPKDAQTLLEHEFRSENFLNTRSITELHGGKLDSDNIGGGSTNKTERNGDPEYTELLMERGEEEHKGDEEIRYVETSQISGGDVVEETHVAMTNDNESLERRCKEEQKNEGPELEPRGSWRSKVVDVGATHVTVYNDALGKASNTELINGGDMREHVDELVANQTQKLNLLEDVAVGTSHLGPIASTVHNLDDKPSVRELDGGLQEKDTQNWQPETGKSEGLVCNGTDLFNKSPDVVDMKSEEARTHLPLESKPTLASQKAQDHLSAKENIVLRVNDTTDVKLEDTLLAEDKAINDQNLDRCISVDERSGNCNKSRDQPPEKGSKATVKRLNLSESWERQSSGRETHQVVALIKAFISAFVKFWS